MITKEIIRSKLSQIVIDAPNLISGQVAFVESLELDEGLTVTLDNFLDRFSSASSLTADALMIIDNDELGYKKYILKWKEKGYIS